MSEPLPVAHQHLQYEPELIHAQQPGWQPALSEPWRTRAQQAALIVAERMRDPDTVHAVASQAEKLSSYPVAGAATSFCAGDAGLALFYEYLDRCFPGQGWGTTSQHYLQIAAASTHQSVRWYPGLFSGISGMALTLSLASRGGKRYQKTLARLHDGLCAQVLGQPWRRPVEERGVADREYDVISGVAGVLTYLVSIEQPDEQVQGAIEHALKYLTWLAEPGQPVGRERWYIPSELLPTDRHRQENPQGHFNCGLAHGLPGPLAALALTWQAGYRYPGLRESIAYLAGWIIDHQLKTPWGIDWPNCVPLEQAADPQNWRHLSPARTAWCYGAPGVARSLWLAGQALNDEQIRQIAIEAIETVQSRPEATRLLLSSHICHGVAGVLQIFLRFAHDCESTRIREQIPLLVQQLLHAFDPASALGFCDMDEGIPIDQTGWLTGAPGIAMVLLAASTSIAPAWDRALVIA